MAKLNTNIEVEGTWYGPDHGDVDVPDDVVDKITAPGVWADGEPEGSTEVTVDVRQLDDEALAAWVADHKVDDVVAVLAAVAEDDDADEAAVVEFAGRLAAAEAAGKARKGVLAAVDTSGD